MQEQQWVEGLLWSDSHLFLFLSPQFCLSPDAGQGAAAGLWCPPSPKSLPWGDSSGPLLSPPVHGLTPGPLPRPVPPLPSLGICHLSSSQGVGGPAWRDRTAALGGRDHSRPWWRDVSILTTGSCCCKGDTCPPSAPPPFSLPPPQWFSCVSTVPFLFYSPFPPFHREIKV